MLFSSNTNTKLKSRMLPHHGNKDIHLNDTSDPMGIALLTRGYGDERLLFNI